MTRSFFVVSLFLLLDVPFVGARENAGGGQALRETLAQDPLVVHLVGQAEVRIADLVVSESTLIEELASISLGALVLVTSESGIPWERDTRLRQEIVASGRPRDVVFVLASRAAEMLRAPEPLSADQESRLSERVSDLGSAEWERREEATLALKEKGSEILPWLREQRARSTDLEVQWRLDEVIHSLSTRIEFEQGFLGISYHYRSFDGLPVSDDGQRLEGAIDIQNVIQATVAARVGIQSGDLIYAINDKPVATPLGTNRITRIFAGLRRGERIKIALLREGEDLRLETEMGSYAESRR